MKVILANPGPGFGPFVRLLDLAKIFIRKAEQDGQTDVTVLFPWVYGGRQKEILLEECGEDSSLPRKVFLCQALGNILCNTLDRFSKFSEIISYFAGSRDSINASFEDLLHNDLSVENLCGERTTLTPSDLWFEISRNPIIKSHLKYCYYTSVAPLADIFFQTAKHPELASLKTTHVYTAYEAALAFENSYRLCFVPHVSSLSFSGCKTSQLEKICWTPPLLPASRLQPVAPASSGIFVSVSGIPRLDGLYEYLRACPLQVYTNCPVPECPQVKRATPAAVAGPHIAAVYARAAWNSIWLANLCSKQLLCPSYVAGDSPEIFFNLKTIEYFQLGLVCRPSDLGSQIFLNTHVTATACKRPAIYDEMWNIYKTLDGLEYCGNRIWQDLNS